MFIRNYLPSNKTIFSVTAGVIIALLSLGKDTQDRIHSKIPGVENDAAIAINYHEFAHIFAQSLITAGMGYTLTSILLEEIEEFITKLPLLFTILLAQNKLLNPAEINAFAGRIADLNADNAIALSVASYAQMPSNEEVMELAIQHVAIQHAPVLSTIAQNPAALFNEAAVKRKAKPKAHLDVSDEEMANVYLNNTRKRQ